METSRMTSIPNDQQADLQNDGAGQSNKDIEIFVEVVTELGRKLKVNSPLHGSMAAVKQEVANTLGVPLTSLAFTLADRIIRDDDLAIITLELEGEVRVLEIGRNEMIGTCTCPSPAHSASLAHQGQSPQFKETLLAKQCNKVVFDSSPRAEHKSLQSEPEISGKRARTKQKMSEEQFVYEGRGEYEKHLIFDEKDEAITAMKEEISLLRGEVGEERAKRVRLLDTLREKVECPVCYEVPPVGPLPVCPNGHTVCHSCNRLPTCPTCRARMTGATSLLSATVLAGLEHPCPHLPCPVLLPQHTLHLHATTTCQYRPVVCPAGRGCSQVTRLDLLSHLRHSCPAVHGPPSNPPISLLLGRPGEIFSRALQGRLIQVGPTWFYLQAELMGPDPAVASVVFSLLQLAGPPELQFKAEVTARQAQDSVTVLLAVQSVETEAVARREAGLWVVPDPVWRFPNCVWQPGQQLYWKPAVPGVGISLELDITMQ